MRNRSSVLKVLTAITAFCLVIMFHQSAYADTDGIIQVNVTYGQTEARSMLADINTFRTGDSAWTWNTDSTDKIWYSDLGELTYDYELEKVAMQRAAELALLYSHTRPDGTGFYTAYPAYYAFSYRAENIAIGYDCLDNAQDAFELWKEDYEVFDGQGHRRNMLHPELTSIGIGYAYFDDEYGRTHLWVQEFSNKIVDTEDPGANDFESVVDVDTTEKQGLYDNNSYTLANGGKIYKSGSFKYGITTDGDCVITGCTAKGKITIPDSIDGYTVSHLAKELFYDKENITSIYIPSTVKAPDEYDYVFSYCYDLTEITVDPSNPELISVDGVLYTKDMARLITYPCRRDGLVYHVPAGVVSIDCTSMASADYLRNLYLDNMDTTWSTYTFYGDDSLTVYYKKDGYAEDYAKYYTELFTEYDALDEQPSFKPLCNSHDWGTAYITDIKAGCGLKGAKSLHCTKCGAIKEDSVKYSSKKPHNYSPWYNVKKATETAAGKKTHVCLTCGRSETKTIAKLAPTLPAVKITAPKAYKKAATVKWKKLSKAKLKKIKKIEIQYSKDKTFKTGVKKKYVKANETSEKITKLTSQSTYYVRIRAYTKSGGKVHVSKWSATKSFAVK